jgi:transposase
VDKLQQRFSLDRVVLVGDRGMLTEPQIKLLRSTTGFGWISALRSGTIRKLVDENSLQMSLFDTHSLAEIRSPLFPNERLVACFNPVLAEKRRRNRELLLAATERDLDKIVRGVARRTRTPMEKTAIAKRAGRILHRHKVAKHFLLKIEDGFFSYQRKEESILRESSLDGIYVIRTSESKESMSAEDTVRKYKNLAQVERAFRSLKGVDLMVRPIFHRTEDHVRAHIFLCMLAYYVEHRLRTLLRPILFSDEKLPEYRDTRDPVKPATISRGTMIKKAVLKSDDGLPIQSFRTLLRHLATRCRNWCRVKGPSGDMSFQQVTKPSSMQEKVFGLLGLCCSQ